MKKKCEEQATEFAKLTVKYDEDPTLRPLLPEKIAGNVLQLARLSYFKKDYVGAIATINTILETAPIHEETLFAAAIIYKKAGKLAEAKASLEKSMGRMHEKQKIHLRKLLGL